MNIATANPSTAQTNTVLVTAISGKVMKIRNIFISSDTTMEVSLENSIGHSLIIKFYPAANGGLGLGHDQLGEAFWSLPHNGIDYTTSADGNVFIKIGYEIV